MAARTAAATATTSRPRRTAASRGGRNHTARLAYDLGRAGEDAPAWIGDNEDWADAYERGVSDLDAAGGENPPRTTARASAPRSSSTDTPDADHVDNVRPIRPSAAPARTSSSGAGLNRQITTVAGHSVSLASVPLGMLAYAALVNLINGTFSRWLSAKLTNGSGSLP